MNDINYNELNNEELLDMYTKLKDFISFLNDEIENSEVEK